MTDFLRKTWALDEVQNTAESMVKATLVLITAVAMVRFMGAVS